MKILVTGANGLIGRKVVRLLTQDKEHQIFATSQKRVQFPPEVNFFTANLVYSDLNKLIETINPEVLIHCAALASPDACEVDRYSCNKINVEVTARLAAACRDYGTHIIFLSTDFVFDGSKGNYSEDDVTSPISYYGESKVEAENALISLNIGSTIIRTSLVFGFDLNLTRPNIAIKVLENLKKGKHYKLPVDQIRTPTDVNDLVGAIKVLTERKFRGIFNISGEQKISVYDLAKQIAHTFGYDDSLLVPTTTLQLFEAAKRPIDSTLIISKANSTIGYKPTPLFESLQNLKEPLLCYQNNL